MKQDDLMNKIKESAEHVDIPDKLKPDNIMNRIKPKRKSRLTYGYVAAVAVLLLCILIFPKTENGLMLPSKTKSDESSILEMEVQVLEDRSDELTELIAGSYLEIYQAIPKREVAGAGILLDGAARTESGIGGTNDSKQVWKEESAEKMFSHSETNTQVVGVDEGDIVKTDGRYIYVSDQIFLGRITIIEVDNGTMTKKSTIQLSGERSSLQEFYIDGNYLSVISMQTDSRIQPRTDKEAVEDMSLVPMNTKSVVDTYDISDKSNPKLLGSVTQDGDYRSSRKVGNFLYLFTNYWADSGADINQLERFIPAINGITIPYERIYLPVDYKGNNMLVISSISLKSPDKVTDQKAILSNGDQFYVSNSNIYVGETKWDGRASQNNYTELVKLSYEDGMVKAIASGIIDGYLNNQFSMDEYDGYLRVVSTKSYNTGEDTNALYILDKDLKKVGSIEDLAPNERVYSARFMGNTGYFVTFRQMDPLFSVDLSDPSNPKVLGELKITGFSNYLHFYTDTLLLGIGEEVNPSNGHREGIKLSMFDITDPSNVVEIHKKVLKNYESSEAFYNHKAVMINTNENFFGFSAEGFQADNREWFMKYLIYTYDSNEGFVEKLNYQLNHGEENYAYGGRIRGVAIEQIFYIVLENKIIAFDRSSSNQISELSF